MKYVLILCFLRSFLHFSSCFRYQTFKQICVFPNAVFHSYKLGHRRSFHSSRPCVLAEMELIPPCKSAGFANINIINMFETREAWSCQRCHVGAFPLTDPQTEAGGGLSASLAPLSCPPLGGIRPLKS